MTKNYMADIAKMLGVELDEEFKIGGIEPKYRFTENGVYCQVDNGWWQCSNIILPKILLGEFEIIKLPWQPKKNGIYYRPSRKFFGVTKEIWTNNPYDFAFYETGMVFRTKEECEAALLKLRKKYLSGGCNEADD